jgi:hypothetical protein
MRTNQPSKLKKKIPNWLNKEEQEYWLLLPEWRQALESEKTRIIKIAALRFGLINGIVVIVSIVIAILLWIGPFQALVMPRSLISIASISCATAASITAIILAFVIFLFGRAKTLEEESRSNIAHEIDNLEAIRVQIADYVHAEVRKTAAKYKMEKKTQNLIHAATEFDDALYEIIRRFKQATEIGTRCDDSLLPLLRDHLFIKAGDWFVAYLKFWEDLPSDLNHREFAGKVEKDAVGAIDNLYTINKNIKRSEDEYQKALNLSLTLPSLLLIVGLALFTIFISDALTNLGEMAHFFAIWLSIVLVVLLATHLAFLVIGVMWLMLREMMIRMANLKYFMQYATKYPRVNKDEMLDSSLKLLMAHPGIDEQFKARLMGYFERKTKTTPD